MSDVQSLSDSPASSGGLGSSLMWEKVVLSPLEMLSVQLEQKLQYAEEEAAAAAAKQNKNGVDLDPKSGKAAGRVTVEVLEAKDLALDKRSAVLAVSGNAQPELYVSTQVTPLSAFEKTAKKHLRTRSVRDVSGSSVSWQEPLVYDGAKAKKFGIKVSLSSSAEVIADVVLGELELRSADFEDQLPHEQWYDLKAPASAVTTGNTGKLLLRVTFEYSVHERLDRELESLRQKKRENDEDIERYKTTSRLVNAPVRHPAAFGTDTARAALYLPGNKFHVDAHHPGAVSVAPLPDKTRIVSPFGRGVVVSFRPEAKMYVVQMDSDPASKNQTLAYLRQNVMTTKDLLNEAIKLADTGNEEFRNGKLEDAVYNYLRSLGYLQRVNQDVATHKEKATIIQTMIRCHLNIGACKLKLNAYSDAEIACTNALGILTVLADNRDGNVVTWMGRLGLSEQLMFEDWPSKARFRRAQACVKLEKIVDAKQDLLLAVKLNPRDKSCRQLLERVTKLADKQKRAEKKAWGGIFDNMDTSAATIKTAVTTSKSTTKSVKNGEEKNNSIFTRKTQLKKGIAKDEEEPWYLTTTALATASVVTAGVAAVALLALKPKNA
ncbi:hypothetical protein BBO99_00001390 [Phytophthora kernoviae]|uniref:peptidylprolyl isomerase n=2 Tax=Phytophthora kernoviae TaxID=325452 RepID=A0A3R7KNF0_9STRA|nr:hypothetical protein G195_002193 [Phytophthora kernoviae 00238/432]KAG2530569.1 hypothetical protein JM16_000878 [Phytophthora kernoviae]KAG2531329.1 hypothetical protein JM18_001657 [Phytophthora kernoviae]RLN26184.1 hypothetical protein BBI17_001259 [Phytophthora kernoviae]RLN84351.1 hypothetical protein BBO99_00001390 [Phytophthora kernoviae]